MPSSENKLVPGKAAKALPEPAPAVSPSALAEAAAGLVGCTMPPLEPTPGPAQLPLIADSGASAAA